MKFLIVLCVVLAVVTADWVPRTLEEVRKDREDCLKEEKVSAEDAQKIKDDKFPDSLEAACYVRCVAQKGGTWDNLKGYNVDRSYETFLAHDFVVSKENLSSCFHQLADAHACVWAQVNMKCLYDNKYVTRKNK